MKALSRTLLYLVGELSFSSLISVYSCASPQGDKLLIVLEEGLLRLGVQGWVAGWVKLGGCVRERD